MSDAREEKSGAADRVSLDEKGLPAGKRGKLKTPAERGRKRQAPGSKPRALPVQPPPRPTSVAPPPAETAAVTARELPDSADLSKQMAEIAGKSQEFVAEFLKRQTRDDGIGMADSLGIGTAFMEM